ncbi:hypothetical protein IJ674_09035 [bacterium]|nr:hypothetical protein [bacterium]
MKVSPINNTYFQGLYKIDRKYVGDNTENFILSNDDIIATQKQWEDDIFVLTPDSKDNEFEECIKKDNGKYWKSKPLERLMMYSNLLKEIYRTNYVSNEYSENWVDYTDKFVPKTDNFDDIPF